MIISDWGDINNKHSVYLENFLVNQPLFMLSKNFNNAYYKRVYIDLGGNYKLNFHSRLVFGTVFEKSIEELFLTSEYTKYWHINKDMILKCNECEYRYMCVDIRVPIKRDDHLYKFEDDCNYNIINSKWSYL